MSGKLLAEWPSSSGGKTYKLEEQDNGTITCTCMDYLTRRRFKGEDCKHIRQYKEEVGA